MSGVVFTVDDKRPTREFAGRKLFFCCASCAEYFDAHREAVARARRID